MIYLDMDGVLADFDRHYYVHFGNWPTRWPLPDTVDWRKVNAVPNFYYTMPLMPDAQKLVDYTYKIGEGVEILTGIPSSVDSADNQKIAWAKFRWPTLKVNCCESKNKYTFAKKGDTLIDDYARYRSEWEKAGGIFILHTDVSTTIQRLWELRR